MSEARIEMQVQSQSRRRTARGIDALMAGYRAQPGVYDELVDEAGRARAHWLPVVEGLAELGPTEARRRFDTADRHLRESGVFYRVYDDSSGGERDWPLSHVPVVVPEAEWRQLSEGLVQRANLMEAILADIYGPGRLVAEGVLPAAIVAGNPEYLRPLAGVTPAGGRHLHLYAADIGRAPDGRWWVISDRAQAPSGAGYAVENRLAMARALPELFRTLNVERLAAFFATFRAALAGSATRERPRIGLLTPGPLNETYFEHAYLARYLGYLLLEGGDLTVHDGTLYVRTIEGLKRVDVLLRRLDADFTDPLELNTASRIGVPGLIEAVRAGSVVTANALGSGFIEARALLGFLPGAARRLMGEELKVPHVATWWCGQDGARRFAREHFDDLAFAHAFRATEPGAFAEGPVAGDDLDATERTRLLARLEARGVDVVAQEQVRLSTTPVWREGRLVPRPFTLRVFLAATRDGGWTVMPGGFCRISEREDVRAISMQADTRAADVWVISDKPVLQTSLLPAPDATPIRRSTGALPSRSADNLFWLGRYLERAEQTLRLVRSLAGRAAEAESTTGAATARRRLADLLYVWGATFLPGDAKSVLPIAREALHGANQLASARVLAAEARRTASTIRDRLSTDAWRAIQDLMDQLVVADGTDLSETDAVDAAQRALRTVAAIAGLIEENINRLAGWRFLELGRRIERGLVVCRLGRQFADANAPAECLDLLLELCDSQITYRSRYAMGAARVPILDLVVLEPTNPRSVAFQAETIAQHAAALVLRRDEPLGPVQRAATKLASDLTVVEAAQIDRARLLAFEQGFMHMSDEIAGHYFTQRAPGPHAREANR